MSLSPSLPASGFPRTAPNREGVPEADLRCPTWQLAMGIIMFAN